MNDPILIPVENDAVKVNKFLEGVDTSKLLHLVFGTTKKITDIVIVTFDMGNNPINILRELKHVSGNVYEVSFIPTMHNDMKLTFCVE